MSIAGGFERFYNFLAKMGLVLRDDPPKVIDMAGRAWGEPVDGLKLSIREIPMEDSRQQAMLSTVIRNEAPERKTLVVPGWLFFYELQVTGSDGADVPLTAYGKRLLQPARRTERIELTLGPGDAKETDLPVGVLYDLRAGGEYRLRVSCRLPDETVLASNEIVVRA